MTRLMPNVIVLGYHVSLSKWVKVIVTQKTFEMSAFRQTGKKDKQIVRETEI